MVDIMYSMHLTGLETSLTPLFKSFKHNEDIYVVCIPDFWGKLPCRVDMARCGIHTEFAQKNPDTPEEKRESRTKEASAFRRLLNRCSP